MVNRLFRILTALFLAIGMFFCGGTSVLADDPKPVPNGTVLGDVSVNNTQLTFNVNFVADNQMEDYLAKIGTSLDAETGPITSPSFSVRVAPNSESAFQAATVLSANKDKENGCITVTCSLPPDMIVGSSPIVHFIVSGYGDLSNNTSPSPAPGPSISANPSWKHFDLFEGDDASYSVKITNSSDSSKKLIVRPDSDSYPFAVYDGEKVCESVEFSINANSDRNLTVKTSHISTGGKSEEYFNMMFRVYEVIGDGDSKTEQEVSSFGIDATVNGNPNAKACSIVPVSVGDTRAFTISCPNTTIINDLNVSDGYVLTFSPVSQGKEEWYSLKLNRTSGTTADVTEETIINTGMYLNGTYNVTWRVWNNDGPDTVYNLTHSGPISCNTTSIVSDIGTLGITTDSDGIHIAGMTEAYITAANTHSAVKPNPSGENNTYVQLDQGTQDSHHNIRIQYAESGEQGIVIPDYNDNQQFIGGLIPTSVIQANSIPAGQYQRFLLHVPGYKEYIVENWNAYAVDIIEGASFAGKYSIRQVVPGQGGSTEGDPWSIIISVDPVPQGDTSRDRGAEYQLLKTMTSLRWTTDNSSDAGWGTNFDEATWDDVNYKVTLPRNIANNFYGMMETPGPNQLKDFCVAIPNYAPTPVYQGDTNDIEIINPLQKVNVLRTYILGTKLKIVSDSTPFLNTFQSVSFQQNENAWNPSTDFSFGRTQPGLNWSGITKNTDGLFEIELEINVDFMKKYRPAALDKAFIVNVHNDGFISQRNSLYDNFNAMKYVEELEAIKDQVEPAETDLEGLDNEALADGQFKHVTFTGGVNDNKPENVDISGTIAGAITTDDLDSIGQTINIDTTITEGIESADEADIMNYLKGHHLGEVKHAVGITVVKTYPDEEPKVLKEIGVNSAIVFSDLPELEPGMEYIIVTKHNGKIKPIPVTYKNGQVIGYTKEFSSFVLTTQETSPEPEPKPAPAPSKKESSSGSSTAKKTDNVVTCQMAGYPASYAWNESAKACQPGYIDNNGVFHLTAGNTNKRVSVVNTSDKGVGGMIAGLASSTVVAIAAAYLLKKYN